MVTFDASGDPDLTAAIGQGKRSDLLRWLPWIAAAAAAWWFFKRKG